MSLILNGEERVLYVARLDAVVMPNDFQNLPVVLLEDHKAVVEKLQQQIGELEVENRAMRPAVERDFWSGQS